MENLSFSPSFVSLHGRAGQLMKGRKSARKFLSLSQLSSLSLFLFCPFREEDEEFPEESDSDEAAKKAEDHLRRSTRGS